MDTIKSSSEMDGAKGITLPASAIGWISIEMYPKGPADIISYSDPNGTLDLGDDDVLRKKTKSY